ncbi:MAG: ABC transporter substrate-binding protein [Planctomycetota bacterium]|jgi:ABC-type branched-subunit amino acid transport system substrate-binding protein
MHGVGWLQTRRLAVLIAALVLAVPALATAGLSEAQRRGKRIYTEGQGRAPISAYLPGARLEVPATAVPCVGCHLADGSGQREGGVQSADIRFTTLSKDLPGVRLSGRAHPPYTEEGLMMAVLAGKDPAGNVLHEAHPHYDLEHEDLKDLLAYLTILGREPIPGVSQTDIRIGMLLPETGPLAEAGVEVRALLAGYFAEVNGRGGLFRRTLTLAPVVFDPERPGAAAEAVQRVVEQENVFCFLANLGLPPEDEATRVLAAAQMPVIAPLLIASAGGYGTDLYTFHIYASIRDQARVMVDFLAEPRPTPISRVALVYASEPSSESGADGAREQLEGSALTLVEAVSFAPGGLMAPEVVARLQRHAVDAVLYFGSGADAVGLLGAAGRQGWRPLVLAPATMVGGSMLALSPDVAASVYLTAPMARPDAASPEMAMFRHLIQTYNVPGRHRSFQLLAYAGARLLEEGLKRSGRTVTRERLVEALGSLWNFATGVTPPLSYHQNRRVGAIGASILKVDVVAKRLIPATPWREPR